MGNEIHWWNKELQSLVIFSFLSVEKHRARLYVELHRLNRSGSGDWFLISAHCWWTHQQHQ